MDADLSVTIIATGFSTSSIPEIQEIKNIETQKHNLLVKGEKKKDRINKYGAEKTVSKLVQQNTIEFDISEEKKKEERDFEALYPTTSKKRGYTDTKNVISNYSEMSDDEVDELESVPAYLRRQIRMNDPKYKKKVSRFSITKDNKISDRNSYLYDQVD